MENNYLGVDLIHWLLAYAGMAIHILLKVADLNQTPDFKIKSHIKKNIYTIIASLIMIPVILVVLTDSSLKDIFPINKATSVLAGYQTQSLFKSLMNMYESRAKKLANDSDGKLTN
jgi:hypothetical protein